MTDPLNPAPYCDPCRVDMHVLCEGWLGGFCSCLRGECLTDLTEPEGEE